MNWDIESRADELTYGFHGGAIDEGIMRVQDSLEVGSQREGQRWLSAAFALVRRTKAQTAPDRPIPGRSAF